MKSQSTLLGPLLQYFFVDYLCTQKRVSPQTIASYRDTFRLLLEFLRDTTGIAPAAARIADLEVAQILAFLDHLETTRHNTIRARKLRLAAIRSFLRIVALREPESVLLATCVLAIVERVCQKSPRWNRPSADSASRVSSSCGAKAGRNAPFR